MGTLPGGDNRRVEDRSLLLSSTAPGTRATNGSPRPCQPRHSPNTKSWPVRDTENGSTASGCSISQPVPSPTSSHDRIKHSEQSESREKMRGARAPRDKTCSK